MKSNTYEKGECLNFFNNNQPFCGKTGPLEFLKYWTRKNKAFRKAACFVAATLSIQTKSPLFNIHHMKKILIIASLLFTASLPISAQNRARVFDNFDTSEGVRVNTPVVKPIVSSRPTIPSKKEATSYKAKMDASDGMGLKNSYNTSYSSGLRMGSSKSLNGFTTGDSVVDSYIVNSSMRYGIDPLLIYSQMHQESAFKKRARSHKGASGLMQLMPATARRFGVTKIYDPAQNIDAGVKYMRWLLDKFNGDLVLALAGYNAGEGAVMKYGGNVPPYRETREYVRRITGRYKQIASPGVRRSVKQANRTQLAKLKVEKPKPLRIYENNVTTVRLPDGRMRLVTR